RSHPEPAARGGLGILRNVRRDPTSVGSSPTLKRFEDHEPEEQGERDDADRRDHTHRRGLDGQPDLFRRPGGCRRDLPPTVPGGEADRASNRVEAAAKRAHHADREDHRDKGGPYPGTPPPPALEAEEH